MSHPTWDLNVSLREFKGVLKNSRDSRFLDFYARVLSRVPHYEAFESFITRRSFLKHYPKVRRRLQLDLLGQGRKSFWDWLYRSLKSGRKR